MTVYMNGHLLLSKYTIAHIQTRTLERTYTSLSLLLHYLHLGDRYNFYEWQNELFTN